MVSWGPQGGLPMPSPSSLIRRAKDTARMSPCLARSFLVMIWKHLIYKPQALIWHGPFWCNFWKTNQESIGLFSNPVWLPPIFVFQFYCSWVKRVTWSKVVRSGIWGPHVVKRSSVGLFKISNWPLSRVKTHKYGHNPAPHGGAPELFEFQLI